MNDIKKIKEVYLLGFEGVSGLFEQEKEDAVLVEVVCVGGSRGLFDLVVLAKLLLKEVDQLFERVPVEDFRVVEEFHAFRELQTQEKRVFHLENSFLQYCRILDH